ncbi:MAG: hypothetical protein JHD21_12315 [Nocardioides sp.]|nr:hypothetical protein [Nocardioides sp.]
MRMRGADELRTRMLRVWQGDETDQTAYLLGADIRKARFSVLTGGGRWRLVLHGRGEKLVLRGFGDGRSQEEQAAALIGDRLSTTWLHSPRELFALRNAIGRVGMVLGGLALGAALVLAVVDPAAWPDWATPGLALGGVLALVVAVLPDVVMEVVWKLRGPAPRPEPVVVTRRYARPALHVTSVDAAYPFDPFDQFESLEPLRHEEPVEPAASGSAMESMTLDLGDLPELSYWPDEVIDLDDLPDLPDWPPEMAPQR